MANIDRTEQEQQESYRQAAIAASNRPGAISTAAVPNEYYATLDRPTAAQVLQAQQNVQRNLAPTIEQTIDEMVAEANRAHVAMQARFGSPYHTPQQLSEAYELAKQRQAEQMRIAAQLNEQAERSLANQGYGPERDRYGNDVLHLGHVLPHCEQERSSGVIPCTWQYHRGAANKAPGTLERTEFFLQEQP